MSSRLRCACGIDIHTHFVPQHFPAYLGRSSPSGWPTSTEAPAQLGLCHRHVLIDGKHYRTVSEQCWSVPQRLADMPTMGIVHQVMSPMPELLSYGMAAAEAVPLLRYLNELMADMAHESGGALSGLAAVPMQDMALAIAELHHAVEVLGLAGVELGSNVNGIPIGDPRFLPFFEACEALDVPVFVHALKPTGMDRLLGPAALKQVLAYPGEVGLAAASVITSNLLLRCPRLRIAFSHGGGTLAALLPRLQQGWQVFPALAEQIEAAPREQARRLFYDTLVFDRPLLHHLVDSFGASQLMLGSDYPFNFQERRPAEAVLAAGFSDEIADALLHTNARRFLGPRWQQQGDTA